MKKTVFTGSGVAIITPMTPEGAINYEELGRIIDFEVENQIDAIVVCGTTGESSTMSDEEHVACITYTVKRAAGRVPVVAGAGSNDTSYAIWMSKEAEAAGADALLHVTPYYNKCTQKGLIRHFTTIADATVLPIILYNIPSRTGCSIQPKTYCELAQHPNIVATKEASGNITDIARVAALCGDQLAIYSGNDDQILPILSLGGKGVISVLANLAPRLTHDLCAAFLQGKIQQAQQMQLRYLSLIDTLFAQVNPIPIKAAMNLLGFSAGGCRLPLTPLEEDAKATLLQEMKKVGLL